MAVSRQILIAVVAIPVLVKPAAAQPVHFSIGAIGGIRFSSGAPSILHDESPRYAVGPALEVSVGNHLAVEVEGLYRRFGYSQTIYVPLPDGVTETPYSIRGRTNSAEFPILGKYYFGSRTGASRFFVGTGYSFQRSWLSSALQPIFALISAGPSTVVISPTVPAGTLGGGLNVPTSSRTGVGAVFEAGWSRKVGPLAFTPTFRYTHWGNRADSGSRNQSEFLLGIWF